MDTFFEIVRLLFGQDDELRQIIALTLRMSFASTALAAIVAIPSGVVLGCIDFPGRKLMLRVTTTLMGLPPVVAGLAVFLLLSRSGPLGSLRLLFSVEAMVIAQVILIAPIVAGLTAAVSEMRFKQVSETVLGLGFSRTRALLMTLTESRSQMVGIILTGFGRAVSEVGAVSIVGGNIQHKTRVMTTSIMMVTNMGRFEMAIALGAVLLLIAFAVNIAAGTLSGETP